MLPYEIHFIVFSFLSFFFAQFLIYTFLINWHSVLSPYMLISLLDLARSTLFPPRLWTSCGSLHFPFGKMLIEFPVQHFTGCVEVMSSF